jgi:hypothetical protein
MMDMNRFFHSYEHVLWITNLQMLVCSVCNSWILLCHWFCWVMQFTSLFSMFKMVTKHFLHFIYFNHHNLHCSILPFLCCIKKNYQFLKPSSKPTTIKIKECFSKLSQENEFSISSQCLVNIPKQYKHLMSKWRRSYYRHT